VTATNPPPHLAEHVIARHQYCQHPGCRVPAHLCDLDHKQPYDPATDQGPDLGGEPRPHRVDPPPLTEPRITTATDDEPPPF
jgi:hypothetical protein